MADSNTRLVVIDKGESTDGKKCIQMELVGKESELVSLLTHLMASQKQLEHLIMKAAITFAVLGSDIQVHVKDHGMIVNKLGGDDN